MESQTETRRTRGRPATGRAIPAAERARRYRARLRERGVRLRTVMLRDPLLEGVYFAPGTLLTPGEQDVLRRFCARFKRLPRLPHSVAVFGSRAKGGSNEYSDLDVAVLADGPRDRAFEGMLSSIALEAQRPYWLDRYGISLRPVPIYRVERSGFLEAIRGELEVVWTNR